MDMFSNVTSSVTTWWGTKGAGGKKGEEGKGEEGGEIGAEGTPSGLEIEGGGDLPSSQPANTDDQPAPVSPAASDKSPPTSEADSASIASQPEEGLIADEKEKDKAGAAGLGGIAVDIEEVSSKAFQSAKNLGSFLFSVGKKAGKTVTDTAKHLKHTVEENLSTLSWPQAANESTWKSRIRNLAHPLLLRVPWVNLQRSILGDFNKEQEAFVQEKSQQQTEAAVPPWVGYNEEEDMKQQIMSLSLDRRNFLRSPPAGVSFQFNYDSMFPVAQATLAEDPNLEKMRFELVPKCISEENFWQNYFYRVSLIKQSAQLSSLAQETGGAGETSGSRKSSLDESKDLCNANSSKQEDCVDNSSQPSAQSNNVEDKKEVVLKGVERLSVEDDTNENEEEWEKELQQELQEYEVVNDGEQQQLDDAEWEKEIQKMLAAEDSSQYKKA